MKKADYAAIYQSAEINVHWQMWLKTATFTFDIKAELKQAECCMKQSYSEYTAPVTH